MGFTTRRDKVTTPVSLGEPLQGSVSVAAMMLMELTLTLSPFPWIFTLHIVFTWVRTRACDLRPAGLLRLSGDATSEHCIQSRPSLPSPSHSCEKLPRHSSVYRANSINNKFTLSVLPVFFFSPPDRQLYLCLVC